MKEQDRTLFKGSVLVVEDEPYVRESLRDMLDARGYETNAAATVESALGILARTPVDVVITDLKLPGAGGLDLIQSVRKQFPDLPIVVLTGFGTISSAVECVRAGASDYILKPTDPDALQVTLDRAVTTRALTREVSYLRRVESEAILSADETPVGSSEGWTKVMTMVRAAAGSDSTVLVLGESGTGKEVVAKLLHRLGARAAGPYVRVNCAAVPLEMWESEFFGHRKGSYTGATADREGRFRLANRGTLFMDEIGSMPPPAQAKLLRVLQDGEFDRLGDEKPTHVDVRVIAATNSDLEADIAAGRFRQDLFYRLNVVRIEIPPLRNRPEDILPLAEKFIREIATRLGRPLPAITSATSDALLSYSWPGNVREVRNVIERALILNPGLTLQLPDLPAVSEPTGTSSTPADTNLNLRSALGRREKEVVLEALRQSAGVRKEASRLLGIDQRNLGYYLRKHGIDPD